MNLFGTQPLSALLSQNPNPLLLSALQGKPNDITALLASNPELLTLLNQQQQQTAQKVTPPTPQGQTLKEPNLTGDPSKKVKTSQPFPNQNMASMPSLINQRMPEPDLNQLLMQDKLFALQSLQQNKGMADFGLSRQKPDQISNEAQLSRQAALMGFPTDNSAGIQNLLAQSLLVPDNNILNLLNPQVQQQQQSLNLLKALELQNINPLNAPGNDQLLRQLQMLSGQSQVLANPLSSLQGLNPLASLALGGLSQPNLGLLQGLNSFGLSNPLLNQQQDALLKKLQQENQSMQLLKAMQLMQGQGQGQAQGQSQQDKLQQQLQQQQINQNLLTQATQQDKSKLTINPNQKPNEQTKQPVKTPQSAHQQQQQQQPFTQQDTTRMNIEFNQANYRPQEPKINPNALANTNVGFTPRRTSQPVVQKEEPAKPEPAKMTRSANVNKTYEFQQLEMPKRTQPAPKQAPKAEQKPAAPKQNKVKQKQKQKDWRKRKLSLEDDGEDYEEDEASQSTESDANDLDWDIKFPKRVERKVDKIHIIKDQDEEKTFGEDNSNYVIKIHADDPEKDGVLTTLIGPRFQAEIPDFSLNHAVEDLTAGIKQVWNPDYLSPDEVKTYLAMLEKKIGERITNTEKALKLLQKFDFDMEKLKDHVKKNQMYYKNYFRINSYQGMLRQRNVQGNNN